MHVDVVIQSDTISAARRRTLSIVLHACRWARALSQATVQSSVRACHSALHDAHHSIAHTAFAHCEIMSDSQQDQLNMNDSHDARAATSSALRGGRRQAQPTSSAPCSHIRIAHARHGDKLSAERLHGMQHATMPRELLHLSCILLR